MSGWSHCCQATRLHTWIESTLHPCCPDCGRGPDATDPFGGAVDFAVMCQCSQCEPPARPIQASTSIEPPSVRAIQETEPILPPSVRAIGGNT